MYFDMCHVCQMYTYSLVLPIWSLFCNSTWVFIIFVATLFANVMFLLLSIDFIWAPNFSQIQIVGKILALKKTFSIITGVLYHLFLVSKWMLPFTSI